MIGAGAGWAKGGGLVQGLEGFAFKVKYGLLVRPYRRCIMRFRTNIATVARLTRLFVAFPACILEIASATYG